MVLSVQHTVRNKEAIRSAKSAPRHQGRRRWSAPRPCGDAPRGDDSLRLPRGRCARPPRSTLRLRGTCSDAVRRRARRPGAAAPAAERRPTVPRRPPPPPPTATRRPKTLRPLRRLRRETRGRQAGPAGPPRLPSMPGRERFTRTDGEAVVGRFHEGPQAGWTRRATHGRQVRASQPARAHGAAAIRSPSRTRRRSPRARRT